MATSVVSVDLRASEEQVHRLGELAGHDTDFRQRLPGAIDDHIELIKVELDEGLKVPELTLAKRRVDPGARRGAAASDHRPSADEISDQRPLAGRVVNEH